MTGQDRMPHRLGDYRLLDRIGEGGMGVVYRARGPGRRTVALKVLRAGVAEEPTARQRLAREVATMRRVRSPYVAEVIDADISGATPYIATRYVPGRTLDEVVTQEGALRGPALARLACGLAEALAAVHAAGVVHRDLKPGNVMLLNGLPVVIDFGIAQGPDATRLTLTGMFMGTPGYLSPEVIEGHPSSEASDVHAWGATVTFAAAGHPPFGTGPYEAVFYRIVNGQPDLAGVPPPLLPLLASALARDPAHRPPAASLSGQAASLDPGSLVPVPVTMAGPTTGPGGSQPTQADAPPAAGVPVAGAGSIAGSLAGGAAGTAGAPAGGPGFAAAHGAVAPEFVPPGTRPLLGSRPPPDDFADVLPPVRYLPEPGPAPPQAIDGPQGTAATPGGTARVRKGWYSPLAVACMVAAVGASVVLPVAGTLSALGLIVMLRAGELAQHRSLLRRLARGARRRDPVLSVLAFPWFAARALLASLLLAPLALAVAAVAGGAALAFVPGQSLPRALAYAAGALVAFYGLGPGSVRPRRQLNRAFAAAIRSRMAQVTALAGMVAFAAATVAAAVSWPSFYWPTTAPTSVPYVGRLHHLGLAGHLLVLYRHGW